MRSKRGVILITVMIFLMIIAITSMGLYSSVYNLFRTRGAGEVGHVKGYYAALGALRYMTTVTLAQGTKSVKNNYPQLWADLNLKGSEDVTITVSAPNANGQYTVSASYSY